MMKNRLPFISISIVLTILFVLSCTKPQGSTTLTLKGYVVAAPSNKPISGTVIKVTNEQSTIGSTTTSKTGEFSITIDKSLLDATYFLLFYEPVTDITKKMSITGIGLSEYDYGNIVLFEELTISGSVVSVPNDVPVENVLITVSNQLGIIGSTKSSSTGGFSMVIPKSSLDNSSILTLYDQTMDISTTSSLPIITGYECRIGNIIIYDRRNPYNLHTFQFGGFTYVVHSVLREKMSLSDAKIACDNLVDNGLSNWFLPNRDELAEVIKHFMKDLPRGDYWTSTFDYTYNKQMYITNHYPGGYDGHCYTIYVDKPMYVVPVSRY